MRAVAIALLFGVAACGTTIEVVPWRGPVPSSVLVVPTATGAPRPALHDLDRAFAEAIGKRGYEVYHGAVALDRLRSVGWIAGESEVASLPLADLAAEFAIDAVCVLDVTVWSFVPGDERPFHYEVTCSMAATRDESVLWMERIAGEEPTVVRRAAVDPFADRDPFQAENPVPWVVEREVLDQREIGRLIARNVIARLPAR